MPPQITLPVFGGQGGAVADFAATDSTATFCTLPSGILLLDSCYAAFLEEIASLADEDRRYLDLPAEAFGDRNSIIRPNKKDLFNNPVLSGTILLLEQALQFLVYIDKTSRPKPSANPISDALKFYSNSRLGLIGFSSGILTACVAAASPSIPSFVVNCVEAYRVALWVGIRSKLHQRYSTPPQSSCLALDSWSLVLIGINKAETQCSIDQFHLLHGSETTKISVTAVMASDLITVSGHPDDLNSFSKMLPQAVGVCTTSITALYHCSARLQGVRNQVLNDIIVRRIGFPNWPDLFVPVRSTHTGDLLDGTGHSGSTLAEAAVDMILLHPVNWDVVIEKTLQSLSPNNDVILLDIGLGSTLSKRLQSSLTSRVRSLETVDLREYGHSRAAAKQEPIAIVGMAVHMPAAASVDDLWKVLYNGINTSSEIPRSRFDRALYADGAIPGRSMKTRAANFIDSAGEFDHRFFNISPREAKSMDPQQRVLLQVGYHALEDAGYVPNGSYTFDPDKIGCFIGCATHDYAHNLRNDIDLYYSTGTLSAFLSGRLSYFLGLGGPSIVVDTACSSSLVAIQQACRALMNQDCRTALAGGVNIISSPDMFLGLEKGHFLSPTGCCNTFDAAADGYSRGEGCGVFVLKRLSDAVAENDRILGVIRGVEVNQSGKAHSITHPHGPTQQSLFKQLLHHSNVDPNSVSVVEAHGTGTQAGDTNELDSIRAALNGDRSPDNPLYVTAIKPNIGHLEAASGSASLAKVLLMFQHRMIPRQVSLVTLNTLFAPLASDNTVIATENVAWTSARAGKPRLAMINNFGAAGSNAALLVEEYIPQTPRTEGPDDARHLVFGLSAKDSTTLETICSQMVQWLQSSQAEDRSLADIAYTLTARRQIFPHRVAVAARTKDELIQKLRSAPISEAPSTAQSAVLVFSGQGCQYRGMGRALYWSSSTFRHHIDECDEILVSLGFPGIKGIIVDNGASTDGYSPRREDFQSALFALQYALWKVWQSWGIKPLAVVGHSLGEYAALVAAEVLSARDALLIIATRAKLMEERLALEATGMVAISAPGEVVQGMLDSQTGFSGLSISCFNSPTDCVVSGPVQQLLDLQAHATRQKWKSTKLGFPYGAHSPAMDSLFDDLIHVSETVKTGVPKSSFVSTVFGSLVNAGTQNFPPSDYFARQCVQPVLFTQAINSFLSSPALPDDTIWIEVGPQPTITPMLKVFPALATSGFLPSLRKGQEPSAILSQSLASLYVSGYPIDWRRVVADNDTVRPTVLPSYPLSGPNFWVPFIEPLRLHGSLDLPIKLSFVGRWAQVPDDSNGRVAIFETPIQKLKEYIHGHLVGDVPLCPASVYLEMIHSSITLAHEQFPSDLASDFIDIHDISFCRALTWDLGTDICTTVLLVSVDLLSTSFTLESRASPPAGENTHVTGSYRLLSAGTIQSELSSALSSAIDSFDSHLEPVLGNNPETFSSRTIYQVIFPRVVKYSAKFQSLQYLAMPADALQATATMVLPASDDTEQFSVHPVFLDTLLHVAGFVANLQGDSLNDAYICKEIGSIAVFSECLPKGPGKLSVYCSLEKCSDNSSNHGFVATSYAYLQTGTEPLVVARMSGIHFQRVRLSGLQTALASLSGKAPFGTPEQQISDPLDDALNSWPRLQQIIAKNCEMESDKVALDQRLDDLGIDSLMRLELAFSISRVYRNFGYRPQEITLCKTTTDILKLICPSVCQTPSSSCSGRGVLSPRTPDATAASEYFSRTLVNRPDSSPPVRKMIADILDIHETALPENVQLSALGFDSLASIEATQTLQHKYSLQIPRGFLSPERTIRDVEQGVLRLAPSALPYGTLHGPFDRMCKAMALRRSLSLLQDSNSNRAPLVLIHDGSGLTVSYERLNTLDRRVWTISNPRFSTSENWPTLTEMAKEYAKLITDEIAGHVILGGWSFGGVLAVEIAAQLRTRSIVVDGVVLIDAPNPTTHIPLSPSIFSQVLDTVEGLDSKSKRLCTEQFKLNGELLRTYQPQSRDGLNHPALVFLRSMEPYIHIEQDNIPSWLSNRSDLDLISSGWNELSDGRLLKALDIPGHHFSPFDPENVGMVSEKIKEACGILDITR